jgi:CubicO group peptidase (beta-lactamase class C family)
MSSGAAFEERYDGRDDLARYGAAAVRGGVAAGARVITRRAHPAGEVFNYASAETDMLALVLRGATGMTLSQYLEPRLWQPMGAETSALWRAGEDGLERAGGNLNATARDWARLGRAAGARRRAPRPAGQRPHPAGGLPARGHRLAAPPACLRAAPRHALLRLRLPGVDLPLASAGASRCWASTARRFRGPRPEASSTRAPGGKRRTARTGQTSMARELGALWAGRW